ncbi:MAG: hypothetical protein O7H41_18595 [Planctomycetota bacterium]|nr:hypothetical protein [Planctomycetota bacterium]
MKDSTAGPETGGSPETYTPSRRKALGLFEICGVVFMMIQANAVYGRNSSDLLVNILTPAVVFLAIVMAYHLKRVIWEIPRSIKLSTDGLQLHRRDGTLETFAWSDVDSATRSKALGERLKFDIGGRTICLPKLGLTKEEWENIGKTVGTYLAREGIKGDSHLFSE